MLSNRNEITFSVFIICFKIDSHYRYRQCSRSLQVIAAVLTYQSLSRYMALHFSNILIQRQSIMVEKVGICNAEGKKCCCSGALGMEIGTSQQQ